MTRAARSVAFPCRNAGDPHTYLAPVPALLPAAKRIAIGDARYRAAEPAGIRRGIGAERPPTGDTGQRSPDQQRSPHQALGSLRSRDTAPGDHSQPRTVRIPLAFR